MKIQIIGRFVGDYVVAEDDLAAIEVSSDKSLKVYLKERGLSASEAEGVIRRLQSELREITLEVQERK